jgi:hypothetical protein
MCTRPRVPLARTRASRQVTAPAYRKCGTTRRAPARTRDAVEQHVWPAAYSRPACFRSDPRKKTGCGTARERLRYCSDSVVSKRRKVTFLSERHARLRSWPHSVNGEKQANTSEHFGVHMHRKVLSPDECCVRGLPGLLKPCGSRRENREFCSDCGAPVSRHSPERGESRIFSGQHQWWKICLIMSCCT